MSPSWLFPWLFQHLCCPDTASVFWLVVQRPVSEGPVGFGPVSPDPDDWLWTVEYGGTFQSLEVLLTFLCCFEDLRTPSGLSWHAGKEKVHMDQRCPEQQQQLKITLTERLLHVRFLLLMDQDRQTQDICSSVCTHTPMEVMHVSNLWNWGQNSARVSLQLLIRARRSKNVVALRLIVRRK